MVPPAIGPLPVGQGWGDEPAVAARGAGGPVEVAQQADFSAVVHHLTVDVQDQDGSRAIPSGTDKEGRPQQQIDREQLRPLQPGAFAVVDEQIDRKSTRLNSSHVSISYAV